MFLIELTKAHDFYSEDGWVNVPKRNPHYPPGLEYLDTLDHIFIEEKNATIDLVIPHLTKKTFIISNNFGFKVLRTTLFIIALSNIHYFTGFLGTRRIALV